MAKAIEWIERFRGSPLLVRTLPFGLVLILTFLQGKGFSGSEYWLYLAKLVVGGSLAWMVRQQVEEARWAVSWEAVVVGVGIFLLWVGIDPFYPSQDALLKQWGLSSGPVAGAESSWNPFQYFGAGTALAWFFVAVRILGSALIVPVLEETFYRSFIYRSVTHPDFEREPVGRWHPMAFVVTALIFGLAHREWLAGILCGVAYQGLVVWKRRLGDAMTAHAITNLMLGIYVVVAGEWKFW